MTGAHFVAKTQAISEIADEGSLAFKYPCELFERELWIAIAKNFSYANDRAECPFSKR